MNKPRNADLPFEPSYDQAELLAVCRQFELSMVVLFGSRATGSPPPTEDSDIDLAVMGCDPRQRSELVRRKLQLISEDLQRLVLFKDLSLAELTSDFIKQATVERLLERIVMRAIDVNEHLISELATGEEQKTVGEYFSG